MFMFGRDAVPGMLIVAACDKAARYSALNGEGRYPVMESWFGLPYGKL